MIRGAPTLIARIGTGVFAGQIPDQLAFSGLPTTAPAVMPAVAKPGC